MAQDSAFVRKYKRSSLEELDTNSIACTAHSERINREWQQHKTDNEAELVDLRPITSTDPSASSNRPITSTTDASTTQTALPQPNSLDSPQAVTTGTPPPNQSNQVLNNHHTARRQQPRQHEKTSLPPAVSHQPPTMRLPTPPGHVIIQRQHDLGSELIHRPPTTQCLPPVCLTDPGPIPASTGVQAPIVITAGKSGHSTDDCSRRVGTFISHLLSLQFKYVPCQTYRSRPGDQPWFGYHCHEAADLKSRAWIPVLTTAELDTLHIATEHEMALLCKSDIKKALGPDNISPHLLGQCAAELATPLTQLCRECLASQMWPGLWKQARVVDVHKKSIRQFGFRQVKSAAELLSLSSVEWSTAVDRGREMFSVTLKLPFQQPISVLGVEVDAGSTFTTHVRKIARKVRRGSRDVSDVPGRFLDGRRIAFLYRAQDRTQKMVHLRDQDQQHSFQPLQQRRACASCTRPLDNKTPHLALLRLLAPTHPHTTPAPPV
ncbi:hypothetical protein O3P69_002960 [Scylla paramamosain]|uniref:Uncharacterized protein n=1 Tax=Scylla paramamosain TaxID=85552 RepID=A0AAW0UL32_SCYPA